MEIYIPYSSYEKKNKYIIKKYHAIFYILIATKISLHIHFYTIGLRRNMIYTLSYTKLLRQRLYLRVVLLCKLACACSLLLIPLKGFCNYFI